MKKILTYIFIVLTFLSCKQRFDPGYVYGVLSTSTVVAVERVETDGKVSTPTEDMRIYVSRYETNNNMAKIPFFTLKKGNQQYETKLTVIRENRTRDICIFKRDDNKIIKVTYVWSNNDGKSDAFLYVSDPVSSETDLNKAGKWKYRDSR